MPPERLLGESAEAEFLAVAPRVGPYLILARGIAFETENIRRCEQVLGVVDQRMAADFGGDRLG
ncbi:hypothetical protein BS329_36410 [Amycolatopsis coloradensis]|uniref:Transcription regulator PadR C-terminal domain-containing protein n=1 Tax=Amycolatopsis coloradensis TaxID=76021 RepID=A0A1R0KGA3_9PSEU|nr:hypothetical protein BS329_36410 [Amycolatopsis coloradensis]